VLSVLLFLLGAVYFYRKKVVFARLLWLVVVADLYLLLPAILNEPGRDSLYLRLAGGRVAFNSIYQLLVLVFFLVSALYFARKWFKSKTLAYLLFNAGMVIVLILSDLLFGSVNFNYQEIGLDYLSFLLLLFFLHLLPLVFVRAVAFDFYKQLKSNKDRFFKAAGYLLLQVSVVLAMYYLFRFHVANALVISVVSFILLFFKRRFLSRTIVIFLLAVSVYNLVSGHALREKQEFVSSNLRQIFLNQSNYAKFIAREIVHQINSDTKDLYEFFQGDTSNRLEHIWRRTIASRENIASGIFILSRDNEELSYFAFQMPPFLKAKTREFFPLWAIEDTTAEIHGKEIPLAIASTGIYKDAQYLGRIIVMVLDSPELLLRYQEKINIFTIDNRINGKDLSYIKLNSKNQVLENPSNINLENVSGILAGNNRWITFESVDLVFNGYIFKESGMKEGTIRRDPSTFIIFFPRDTIFKELSRIIKIFLFFSLFYLLFFIRDLQRIEWRTIYYSYSIRVFSFLILISMLTAIVFSIFFINFSYKSSEQKVMRIMYENGRTAQNTGYNMIKGMGEFNRVHLFDIAKILNADVTVYDEGGLVDTSNYRKLIDAEIPIYMHSKTLSLLNEKNQRFVLVEDSKGIHLFFKVYDYIFMVQYSNTWEETLSEGRYYTDFIITLFFILMVIGFWAAFFFRNKILSPIEGLNRGMAEVERGELPILENIPAEIEIKSLYTGFNDMIKGIREQKKNISEISRMKTIIRLGRHVAHEVKNPLTPIQLSAEQILRSLNDKNPDYEEIIRQSVNYIIDETEHLRKVSYGFLDLSKLDEINAEEFDLMELVCDEMFSVEQIYSHIDCSIYVDGNRVKNSAPVNIIVSLDKIKIKQVLKNLINNSVEAIGEKEGSVRLNIKQQYGRVMIRIDDNGVGMEETDFDRVFEKDYSTKEVGTGLGLFIVKRIVELHKGTIEICSEKNKGTVVVLDLPERVES
jgi:signal transduction histidine kinase